MIVCTLALHVLAGVLKIMVKFFCFFETLLGHQQQEDQTLEEKYQNIFSSLQRSLKPGGQV